MSGPSIKNMADDTERQQEIKHQWLGRASAVGLDEDASETMVTNAEESRRYKPAYQDLGERARAVRLPVSSSEDKIRKAEGLPPIPKDNPIEFRKRAEAVGLDDKASVKQLLAAEKKHGINNPAYPDGYENPRHPGQHGQHGTKADLAARARAVGLTDAATLNEVVAAEDRSPDGVSKPKLVLRARAVGLADNATLEQVIAAENK